jgi:hypothetical protein
MADFEFTPAERAAIASEWRRLSAEPRPTNPRPYGCATFLVAGALFLALPSLVKALGQAMPEPLRLAIMAALVLALAGGFVVGVFFGSGVYGRAAVRARAALDWLAANPDSSDADERRANAVALVYYTVVWEGPTVATTHDPAESRGKLGTALPYVLAVERVLVEEVKAQPVFTS